MSLSQNYINHLVTHQEPATVFMKSGVRIANGYISAFDGEAMFYTSKVETQLIFSDSVASVMPVNPIAQEIIAEMKEHVDAV